MHIYRDRATLSDVATVQADTQLQGLIAKRLQDLSDYKDYDLADLIQILVIEPSDALTDVDAELGFSLVDRPWDVVEIHPGLYEITVIVSDDGFGWVMSDFKVTARPAAVAGSMTKRVEVDSSGLLWRAQSGRLLN